MDGSHYISENTDHVYGFGDINTVCGHRYYNSSYLRHYKEPADRNKNLMETATKSHVILTKCIIQGSILYCLVFVII